MTKQEKINWLKEATAEQLFAQYNSSYSKYLKLSLMDANFAEVMEDWELANKEMLKRLTLLDKQVDRFLKI